MPLQKGKGLEGLQLWLVEHCLPVVWSSPGYLCSGGLHIVTDGLVVLFGLQHGCWVLVSVKDLTFVFGNLDNVFLELLTV